MKDFSKEQIVYIKKFIAPDTLQKFINKETEFTKVDSVLQLAVLEACNSCYRAGVPLLDDKTYDVWQLSFKIDNPTHPFVTQVESEPVVGKLVQLPQKMLSTAKAYSETEILQWLQRIIKAASQLDIASSEIEIKVTPKLDGYAAFNSNNKLYTRGNGLQGRDISFVLERGLQVAEGNILNLGQGEIVIDKEYFKENLAAHFENSRNIQAAIIAEKTISPLVQQAIDAKAAVFFPFCKLPAWQGSIIDLKKDLTKITQETLGKVNYDVDGVILETTNTRLKEFLGATRHHYRWQIALKSNDEMAEVRVKEVIAQTSRNGKITPVAILEPTRLSGAEITRATAHNYKMVRDEKIGPDTIILLVRSGLVIPKIEKVLIPTTAQIPTKCPCCAHQLVWIDDNLFCPNRENCRDQIEKSIIHFFDTLGNNDGFGPATIANFYENNIKDIYSIYQLVQNREKLELMGYKEKTVENLIKALDESRQIEIEDWRFLAAFGMHRLGLGMAEKLLAHHSILELFTLNEEQLIEIEGFAAKTAAVLVQEFAKIKDEFMQIYNLGFNLKETLTKDKLDATNAIFGKIVVFTGTMQTGTRGDLEKQAKLLGAKVAKAVTGKTNYLITGKKVGASKINAATAKGVSVITEEQYLAMLKL